MAQIRQLAIQDLYLFPVFSTRKQYEKAFGEQPPPFDPKKPPKHWRDPSPAGDTVTYTVFDWESKTVRPLTMKAEEAAAINIPGEYRYPVRKVQPTPAVVIDIRGEVISGVNPETLSSGEEARAIAEELEAAFGFQADVIDSTDIAAGPFRVDYRGEQRRQWAVRLVGKTDWMNVGALLAAKNAYGAGAPGHWEWNGRQTEVVWVPERVEHYPPPGAKAVPVPIRLLKPNEEIIVTPFSAYVSIKDDRLERRNELVRLLEEALEIARRLNEEA